MRNRYYDPKVGGFAGEDPVDFGDGKTRYGYVLGNPAKHTDPSGLCPPSSCSQTATNTMNQVCSSTSTASMTNAAVKRCLQSKCKTVRPVCASNQECNQVAQQSGNKFVFGFSNPGSNVINLCSSATGSSCQLQTTIIHEMLHLCHTTWGEDLVEDWAKGAARQAFKCWL
jgi:hypothetical protein